MLLLLGGSALLLLGGSAIEFSGLRPGEKLFEELLADRDETLATAIAQLRVARIESGRVPLDELLAAARAAQNVQSQPRTAQSLARLVPEYRAAASD
jgi:FlaA1/EpsC-like NDP-sugar epimerase